MTRATTRILAAELLIALAFTLLALLVRLPELQQIPRFTDETGQVQTALSILRQGARPLVDDDPNRGVFWAYLLATSLAIFGAQPALPRLFACVLGALTVGATYGLGRARAGRLAGGVAALGMTTAFSHVALNSHVAWSNSSTPLWTTLAVLCTYLAAKAPQETSSMVPRDLALLGAGLMWGLALHTHLSVLPMIAGAVFWWLADRERRARLKTPAPYAAVAVFLVVLSPMIVFNLQSMAAHQGLASVRDALGPSQPIARDHGPAAIAGNAIQLAGQLGRAAGAGPLVEPGDPTPGGFGGVLVRATDALRPFATVAYALLLFGALAYAALRGSRLLAAVAGTAVMVLPFVNRAYTGFYDTRYIAFLLPLGYVALAEVVAVVSVGAGRANAISIGNGQPLDSPQSVQERQWQPWKRRVWIALFGLMVAYPLASLGAYYARENAAGRTNRPIWVTESRLVQANTPSSPILIDKAMRKIKHGGGGDPARAFDELLALADVPHQIVDEAKMRWFLVNDPKTAYRLIAADATAAVLMGEFKLASREEGDGWVVLERAGQP